MSDIYRAIADPNRRILLDEIADGEGKTLFDLCSTMLMKHGLELTRQAISQHLTVLEDARLVTTERRGRSKFHYFNPEPLDEITRRWPKERESP